MRPANPPLISKTNLTPAPPSIPVRSCGTAFSWMRVIRPVSSANSISNGISVFFIQNCTSLGASKTNNIPAALGKCARFIRPNCCSAAVSAISTAKLRGADFVSISMRSGAQAAWAGAEKISAAQQNPKTAPAPPFFRAFHPLPANIPLPLLANRQSQSG